MLKGIEAQRGCGRGEESHCARRCRGEDRRCRDVRGICGRGLICCCDTD